MCCTCTTRFTREAQLPLCWRAAHTSRSYFRSTYPSAVLNTVEHLANRTLGRTLLRSATRLVFCTAAAKEFAAPLTNGKNLTTSFIPNGIDTDRFKPPVRVERENARETLEIERDTFYLRLFTKLAIDLISLAHLVYQRVIYGRRAWTWSEAADVESGIAFRLFSTVFPLLWAFSRLDRVLGRFRGFGLVASVRKRSPE